MKNKEEFHKYDTILAERLDSEISHKGFIENVFTGRLNAHLSRHYKTVYLVKTNGEYKKFYAKRKLITIYSCRIVLIEKKIFK